MGVRMRPQQAVSPALHMAELGPAHGLCLWFCSFSAALGMIHAVVCVPTVSSRPLVSLWNAGHLTALVTQINK